MTLPRIAISTGDPAGVGPDVVLTALQDPWPAELVVIADQDLLAQRAELLSIEVHLQSAPDSVQTPQPHTPGSVRVQHQPLATAVTPGLGEPRNAAGTLKALDQAIDGCRNGSFQAMVTAPVNKAVISDSGVPFSGHTEYLAEETGTEQVVMLLTGGDLRVALATTHIPLKAVPNAINTELLTTILHTMHRDLQSKFTLTAPRISVLGLNPHAGEGGHLGHEDSAIIAPAIAQAQAMGIQASGPWPADTAFNTRLRKETDAYLAMYHDQGLPVLKYASFGAAVNVTLGLPIVRTSVDHGTAYDLAGTGNADDSSFRAALQLAIDLAQKRSR